jgi:hypothetical protein
MTQYFYRKKFTVSEAVYPLKTEIKLHYSNIQRFGSCIRENKVSVRNTNLLILFREIIIFVRNLCNV